MNCVSMEEGFRLDMRTMSMCNIMGTTAERRRGGTGREDGRLYEKENDDWKCFRVGTVESGYRVMSPGFFVCIAANAGSTCLLSLCIGCFLMLMVVIVLIELNSIHCLRKQ